MNFSPRLLNSQVKLNNLKLEKLHCRNFIFTILVFDLFKNNFKINFLPTKPSIFIIKKRKHIGSFLRAPYKCKSAQFSLGLYRYFLILTFKINTTYEIKVNNSIQFKIYIKQFLANYNFFESTLVTQIYRSIKIPVKLNII